jgi:hypothetical protein
MRYNILENIITIFNLSIQYFYNSETNTTLNFDRQNLIQQNKSSSKLECLASCDKITTCQSLCYSELSSVCFLYNQTGNFPETKPVPNKNRTESVCMKKGINT